MLVDYEDSLCVIEITIVQRPYVLYFAKATIDQPPDSPPHVLREWLQQKAKDFGHHWPAVVAIVRELTDRYGVHLTDLNQNNIAFVDQPRTEEVSPSPSSDPLTADS